MGIRYIYGPAGAENAGRRIVVDDFNSIEEPWKSYAVMFDAGANEDGCYIAPGVGNRQSGSRCRVWYLFEPELWARLKNET